MCLIAFVVLKFEQSFGPQKITYMHRSWAKFCSLVDKLFFALLDFYYFAIQAHIFAHFMI